MDWSGQCWDACCDSFGRCQLLRACLSLSIIQSTPHPNRQAPPQTRKCRYAEGLLLAIHHLSKLGAPIYITETGVADAGDELRPVMIQTYMEQVGRGWLCERERACGLAMGSPTCYDCGRTIEPLSPSPPRKSHPPPPTHHPTQPNQTPPLFFAV